MKRSHVALGIALAIGSMAPTPGDIGGCGQRSEDLDPPIFLRTLQATDCSACQTCGFVTATCENACGAPPPALAFPEGCAPLAHDGEVCLRRLQRASCGEYEPLVADDSAGKPVPLSARPRPSECQFCPPP